MAVVPVGYWVMPSLSVALDCIATGIGLFLAWAVLGISWLFVMNEHARRTLLQEFTPEQIERLRKFGPLPMPSIPEGRYKTIAEAFAHPGEVSNLVDLDAWREDKIEAMEAAE